MRAGSLKRAVWSVLFNNLNCLFTMQHLKRWSKVQKLTFLWRTLIRLDFKDLYTVDRWEKLHKHNRTWKQRWTRRHRKQKQTHGDRTQTNEPRCRQLCTTPWRATGEGAEPSRGACNLHRKHKKSKTEQNWQIVTVQCAVQIISVSFRLFYLNMLNSNSEK